MGEGLEIGGEEVGVTETEVEGRGGGAEGSG